ncbi:fumarylacetoacetate hydrolase family protein [Halosegnis sp.]|uniref:fumarylacetoacetate hydrolase family protein n=1 Tax=Halosegnis sp. TaxID=2864959 RepID=UPI0035D51171
MHLGQYSTNNGDPWVGVRHDDETIVNVQEAGRGAGLDLPATTSALLDSWHWQQKVQLAAEYAAETGTGLYVADQLDRHAPVSDPEKVVCVGLNYRDHAEEGGNEIPDTPVLFSKFPTSVAGPDDTISWSPDLTEQVDYEAELVAVIGEETRRVTPEEAMDHVAGFLVGNDVSARDLQHGDGQWVRGKSLDGFAPIGPELVTADAVPDPHDLDIYAEVNGERLQDSTTANLIFGIDELVSFCSQAFTLQPGDLLFTGTPPGVGVYREPPVLLEDGDTVTIGVEGLGELTNDCAYE